VAELWTLLGLVLQTYARRHARALGHLSDDDVREVAAEKASELLRRLDSREWDPTTRSAEQLCGFLATVARNGVVDFHRRRRREVPVDEGTAAIEDRPQASPEMLAQAAAYARAILDCARGLTDRSRRAWLLRVLYELESEDIARDPGVVSTGPGVDTMLARCRAQMRSCMEGKGLALGPLPPGTFVRLWDLVRREGRG
jgi:RNA polymerase sigma factor (sigma-70 family)